MSSRTKTSQLFLQKLQLFASLALCFLVLSSCVRKEPMFDGDKIIGKWVSGTEYWRYDDDGNGVTWDTKDDVTEEEGQPFTWSFDENTSRLTQIHIMEMGGRVPKYYTITALDDSRMSYKDNYGNISSFTRVIQ